MGLYNFKKVFHALYEKVISKGNGFFYHIGYHKWLLQKKQKKGVNLTILAYHSVKNEKIKYSGLEVSAKNFETQLSLIQKYFDVISMEKALHYLECDPSQIINKIVVTFDDGYKDNYDVAFSILKEKGISATVFLTTDPIERKTLLWGNLLEQLFATTKISEILVENLGLMDLSTQSNKLIAYKRIKKFLKYKNNEQRIQLFRGIVDKLKEKTVKTTDKRFEMLTLEDISEMSNFGISFENHTNTHPVVSMLNDDEIQDEILQANASIFKWTGRESRVFAYPFGQERDISEQSKQVLKKLGFSAAFTLFRGTNHSGTDKYELKRIPVKDCSKADFASFLLKYI